MLKRGERWEEEEGRGDKGDMKGKPEERRGVLPLRHLLHCSFLIKKRAHPEY